MKPKKTTVITITGPFTLGDLRQLITDTEQYSAESTITVKEYKSWNPVDWDAEEISVHCVE